MMPNALLGAAVLIIACLLSNRVFGRLGMPTLLAFLGLGMLCGSDGLLKIAFDDFALSEQVSSVALIFIIFYGGFWTNWRLARPVVGKAVLLSSAGVVLTAVLVGAFCHWALGMPPAESLLVGALISSTDAASVFSILRAKRLNLRYGTASMLEMESGSNDCFSYMLTVVILAFMGGSAQSPGAVAWMLGLQIVAGALCGVGIALAAHPEMGQGESRGHEAPYSRNGFCVSSRAIVVAGPWPQSSVVAGGTSSAIRCNDAMICPSSPPARSVRPWLPGKSVSPTKATPSAVPPPRSTTPPGVWPGVSMTVNVAVPTRRTTPSARRTSGAGAFSS